MVDAAAERRAAAAAARCQAATSSITKEVASAWEGRIGPLDQSASADRVQSLFNDIELYPTKTQVFEMLVCARQCARRKSLTLTFGEFCVFAAELRRCSRQARQNSGKLESPQLNLDKELREKDICKPINGSDASPPPCEVFLGGSCNPTTWRSDIAIPMLKKMGITYFNPQVEDWSTELIEVEHRAKAAARALLFVLDSETRTVAASVEAAHLAAAPRDLLLVLRPYSRHQTIGNEAISDHEYSELSRARATLQEVVERRGLPAFADIPAALRCARAVVRGARTQPRHSLGHTILRLKRAYDAARDAAGPPGAPGAPLPRARALAALREVTRAPPHRADRLLPPTDAVDFETFCAAVAELAAEPETRSWNGQENVEARGEDSRGEKRLQEAVTNGYQVNNARLKAYGRKLGLFIPKNGGDRGSRPEREREREREREQDSESVLTPRTERRLERLPAMLGAPTHDVYLAGSFPSSNSRAESAESSLRREGLTCVVARANDYSRMFSTAARRAAPAHPESPRNDKKPRASTHALAHSQEHDHELVQLRDNSDPDAPRAADRLSASDFYTVTEDVTPQPFKGTYDEDLLLGSRVLVFSMSAETPSFATMVLAAHYTGLRPDATVLLVQPMDSTKAHGYSEAAIKDYNRGRHYLSDLALRSGVPVFDNIEAVVACVVSRLRPTL